MENVNSAWLTCQARVAACAQYLRSNLRALGAGGPGAVCVGGAVGTGLEAEGTGRGRSSPRDTGRVRWGPFDWD